MTNVEFMDYTHFLLSYRRYALEAIINDIIYLRVHNYVYVPCYNCYGSRVCNNHEARRKTHMHVWNNKR